MFVKRSDGSLVRYLRLDPEASALLDELALSPQKKGALVSELLRQHHRERELRRRLSKQILQEGDDDAM
jgi:hypothetical protein